MEDTNKEENTETLPPETQPETEKDTETIDTPIEGEETETKSEDIDFEKELENLEGGKPEKSELEKAKRSLHFNAERVKELGGDPTEIVGKPKAETTDVKSEIDKKFAERDARSLAKSDAEFKVMMWYVNNKGLSIQEAHLLANKGKIMRFGEELKRSNVETSKGGSSARKVPTTLVPERSPEEVAVLTRRGLKLNPKTKTYQGKIYEEYWTGSGWASRKIQR